MNRNTWIWLACTACVAVLGGGCALNIDKMPVDQTAFNNPHMDKIKAAENASSDSFPRLVVAPQDEKRFKQDRNEELLGTYLDTKLASLPGFIVIPRAELGALNTENALTAAGNGAKIGKADYLITYQFVSAKRESRSEEKYAGNGNYRTIEYYTNRFKGRVSVLEVATGHRAFTKVYEVAIPTGTSQTEDWDKAAEMLADKVSRDFYARYGLPVYVEETRGNGRVARLSRNFLTTQLPKGTKVIFKGDKEATGKVYSGYWVEVDDVENAGVSKNQPVLIEIPE